MLKSRVLYTSICEPNPSHHLLLRKQLYWNMATPICLHIVCGCLHTTAADSGGTYRACKATNIYRLASYKKYYGQVQTQNRPLLSTRPPFSGYFVWGYIWVAGVQRLRDTQIQRDTLRGITTPCSPCATYRLKEQRKQNMNTF